MSKYSSDVSSSGMGVGFTPAQLKTKSMPPKSDTARETNSSTSSESPTSTTAHRASTDSGRLSASDLRELALMSQRARSAPSEENRADAARLVVGVIRFGRSVR